MATEQSDAIPQLKKSKLENGTGSLGSTGKENLSLKTYPKRNRKQSLKGILTLGEVDENVEQEDHSEVDSTNSTDCAVEMVANPMQEANDSKGGAARQDKPICSQSDTSTSSTSKAAKAKVATKSEDEASQSDTPSSSKSKAPKANGKGKGPKANSKSKATPRDKSKSLQATDDEPGPPKRKRCMPKTVDKHLEKMGFEAGKVSCCLKSALGKGFYKITGDPSDLEQVVIEGEYEGHTFKVLVKDVLYQPDYAGMDYEDGMENATALCVCCTDDSYERGRAYVTRICEGLPYLDSGKSHNHCTVCKGFGKCIGDYREEHCMTCNKHWFAGLTGFPCSNCEQKQKKASLNAFMDRVKAGELGRGEELLGNLFQASREEDCCLM